MKNNKYIWILNFLAVVIVIFIVFVITQLLTKHSVSIWPDYASMQTLSTPIEWIRWVLGDMSEAQFYKNEFASLGLIIGATIAYFASIYKKCWQGFEISYGTGLFPWIFLSSSLGLIFSNLLWGWVVIESQQWQPTFVAFVSLPAAVVLMYGRGLKIALVGAVLGTILVTPCSILFVNYLCRPFNLPNVIGNVSGMAIGSLIAFVFLHKFKFLVSKPNIQEQQTIANDSDNHVSINLKTESYGPLWTVRRMLADFSESQFFANEIASLGYLFGVFYAIYLNPFSIAYGSDLIGKILISQFLASGLAILLWRKQWQLHGWYPTYIPISSVAPAAVLFYNGSLSSIILGAILGAMIAPPLAKRISDKLAHYQHPYIGNVISMAITTLLTIAVIALIS